MDRRVLIVEGEEDFIFFMEMYLKKIDPQLKIDAAGDGEEGYRAITSKPRHYYDLILMDWHMNMMCGDEVLRKCGQDTSAKIWIASASMQDEIQQAFSDIEYHGIIHKPISQEKLHEVIKEVFG